MLKNGLITYDEANQVFDFEHLRSIDRVLRRGEEDELSIPHGQLLPDVGAGLLQALGTTARIIETTELEQRIAALEQRQRTVGRYP